MIRVLNFYINTIKDANSLMHIVLSKSIGYIYIGLFIVLASVDYARAEYISNGDVEKGIGSVHGIGYTFKKIKEDNRFFITLGPEILFSRLKFQNGIMMNELNNDGMGDGAHCDSDKLNCPHIHDIINGLGKDCDANTSLGILYNSISQTQSLRKGVTQLSARSLPLNIGFNNLSLDQKNDLVMSEKYFSEQDSRSFSMMNRVYTLGPRLVVGMQFSKYIATKINLEYYPAMNLALFTVAGSVAFEPIENFMRLYFTLNIGYGHLARRNIVNVERGLMSIAPDTLVNIANGKRNGIEIDNLNVVEIGEAHDDLTTEVKNNKNSKKKTKDSNKARSKKDGNNDMYSFTRNDIEAKSINPVSSPQVSQVKWLDNSSKKNPNYTIEELQTDLVNSTIERRFMISSLVIEPEIGCDISITSRLIAGASLKYIFGLNGKLYERQNFIIRSKDDKNPNDDVMNKSNGKYTYRSSGMDSIRLSALGLFIYLSYRL